MTSNSSEDVEPVMCSKCNEVFRTDSDFRQHYDQKHNAIEAPENDHEQTLS
jgi:uncharacterized C2H2 Zn-finger protein